MSLTSYRARFKGTINNIEVKDLMQQDYELSNLEERMAYIKEKYDRISPFFEGYLFTKEKGDMTDEEWSKVPDVEKREFYKVNVNTDDELSEEINIFKYVENDATYLLNSRDIPRERQQKYKILTEQAFKTILKKEQLLSSMAGEFDQADVSMEDIILDTRPANDYNNLNLLLNECDFDLSKQRNAYGVRDKDIELARVLNSYRTYYDYLRREMARAKAGEETKLPLYKIIQLTSGVKKDMLDSKKMILGIRNQAKRLGDESPMNDMSEIDYNNPEHIKVILKNCTFGTLEPDNEMTDMAYDMEVAISNLYKTGVFDETDCEIIEMYNSGYTNVNIAEEFNIKKQSVGDRINKIARKISEYHQVGEMFSNMKKMLKK